jgi:Rrf2 family protein
MLSKKSKYAIKALVCIAENYGNAAPLKISEISEREKIPRKFLETIMVELRNQGFVHSKMGANGGYSLAKTPDTIVLSQIIRLSGGPLALLPCASLNFYERCEECVDEATCSLRQVMQEVRDVTLQILSKTSLADLIAREKSLIQALGM